MAVLERYDKPFDRFARHDHSKHLNVDVVSRGDMRESTTVVRDGGSKPHVISSDDKSRRGESAFSRNAGTSVVKLLYWVFALFGVFHPVFALVAFFAFSRAASRGARTAMLVASIVLWVIVAILIVLANTNAGAIVDVLSSHGYEVSFESA